MKIYKAHMWYTLTYNTEVSAETEDEAMEKLIDIYENLNIDEMVFRDGDFEIVEVADVEDTPTAPVEHEMDFKGFTESEREDFEAWDDFLGFDEHTTVIESRDGSRKYKISDLHFDPTYVDSTEELMKVVRTDLAEWRRDGALV